MSPVNLQNLKQNFIYFWRAHPLGWILTLLVLRGFLLGAGYFFKVSPFDEAAFCSLDCTWFRDIAKFGYQALANGKIESPAFFPLFAIILGILKLPGAFISPTYLYFGYCLGMATLCNLLLFHWLPFAKKSDKLFALLLFNLDPNTIWILIPYSESLLFVLTIALFLTIRQYEDDQSQSTRKLYLAAIYCGLACMTKVLGVALGFGFLIFLFFFNPRKIAWPHKLLISIMSFSGLVSYMIFLYFHFGNPLQFYNSQKYWGRQMTLSFESLFNFFYGTFVGSPETLFLFGIAVYFLINKHYLKVFTKVEYWVFFVYSMIPLLTQRTLGLPRFYSVLPFGLWGATVLFKRLKETNRAIYYFFGISLGLILAYSQFWNFYDYFHAELNLWTG